MDYIFNNLPTGLKAYVTNCWDTPELSGNKVSALLTVLNFFEFV